MRKCFYCGKTASEKVRLSAWNGLGLKEEDFYFCSESCKTEIEHFISFGNKHAPKFIVLLIVWVIVLILSYILVERENNVLYLSLPFFLLGVLLTIFPFASTPTYDMLGLKKATKLTKVIAIFLITFSVIIFVGEFV